MEERVKELSKYRFEASLENLEDARLMQNKTFCKTSEQLMTNIKVATIIKLVILLIVRCIFYNIVSFGVRCINQDTYGSIWCSICRGARQKHNDTVKTTQSFASMDINGLSKFVSIFFQRLQWMSVEEIKKLFPTLKNSGK